MLGIPTMPSPLFFPLSFFVFKSFMPMTRQKFYSKGEMEREERRENNGVSLWIDQASSLWEERGKRKSLQKGEKVNVDVAIIGGGFTGLWTAYHLKLHSPHLKVSIFEKDRIGTGASGVNGGWVMGEILGFHSYLSRCSDLEMREKMLSVVHSIPQEVEKVIKKEKIDCNFRRNGMLYVAARYPEQKDLLMREFDELKEVGFSEESLKWFIPSQVSKWIKTPKCYGATYNPHCATIQPSMLVYHLGQIVEKMGVTIYENTNISKINYNEKVCVGEEGGEVVWDWVVPVTEGNGGCFPEFEKSRLTVQSLIIATEPLGDQIWEQIGCPDGLAFGDGSRQVTYAQRTVDNRLVFGARGSYLFGGKQREKGFQLSPSEIESREKIMLNLFPCLEGTKITHAWGGNLSIPRTFEMKILQDKKNKVVFSGGYGGEGVGASFLGGRTVADLVLGRDSLEVSMPWVICDDFRSLRKWEREPFPFLGYHTLMTAYQIEDRICSWEKSPRFLCWVAIKFSDLIERILHS